jgi:hypothetical protein
MLIVFKLPKFQSCFLLLLLLHLYIHTHILNYLFIIFSSFFSTPCNICCTVEVITILKL